MNRKHAAWVAIGLSLLAAGCRSATKEGLAVTFDVQALPPEPEGPPAQPPPSSAISSAKAIAPGPMEPGESVQVEVKGSPGMTVRARIGAQASSTPLKEDASSPGTYRGSVPLGGLAPGRHAVVVTAEGGAETRAGEIEIVTSRAALAVDRLRRELTPILFDSGRWSLTDEARAAVESNGRVLAAVKGLKANVEGHGDDQGSDLYNVWLGMWRAKTVKDALARAGVPPSSLTILSHGRTQPRVEGSDPESRAANRRVEIVVSEAR